MDGGIYCYTFAKFYTDSDPLKLGALVLKSFLAFIIQFSLITLIAYEMWVKFAKDDLYEPSTASLNMTRLICALLLHVQLIPEVRTAFGMMKFVTTNAKEFKCGVANLGTPFLIAVVKFLAVLFCEILNLNLICASTTVVDIVKDFVAIGVIADIDDIITGMLGVNDVEGTIAQANMKYDDTKGVLLLDDMGLIRDIYKENREYAFSFVTMVVQFIGMLVVRICKFSYDVAYYYFAPYLVFFLIFAYG